MRSIESLGLPLAFPVALDKGRASLFAAPAGTGLACRVHAGALVGMQKEALVADGGNGTLWRMVCDEGPYLNGTDLAPFPLAFFTAGMALSVLGEVEALARRRGIDPGDCRLVLDNRYGMEGSALKGTMTGSALPVDLTLLSDADLARPVLAGLLSDAALASPAIALLRHALTGQFAILHDGRPLAPGRVPAHAGAVMAFDEDLLGRLAPAPSDAGQEPIIEKLSSAETVFGVEGGAGSSLAAEQSRTLHVRGTAMRRPDGLYEVKTQLFKPIGSVFRFVGDGLSRHGGGDRAPSALAYLSAGIAFCYLTQIGRFAHIAKIPVSGYGIVQDTAFSEPQASAGAMEAARAEAPISHVTIRSDAGEAEVRRLVDMGEQTCFLHAACRSVQKPRIHVARKDAQ
ncbi:MAG: hypothetical protein Tsb008_10060 [Rhodothalassiaceae bacterium]